MDEKRIEAAAKAIARIFFRATAWEHLFHSVQEGCIEAARAAALILYDDRVREKAQAQTVWVVERFEDGNGKSLGYWTGHNSRDFTPNIIDAMQFVRRDDALLAKSPWHWRDCEATEHSYILAGEG